MGKICRSNRQVLTCLSHIFLSVQFVSDVFIMMRNEKEKKMKQSERINSIKHFWDNHRYGVGVWAG